MRRHGNLWDKLTDIENIQLAFNRAKRGKSHYTAVKKILQDEWFYLYGIRHMLLDHKFHTAKYQTKEIFEPKHRTIYILPFYPDRIVQHALMNVLEPIWTGLFINDTYACIKKRGLHAGSQRCMEFVRKYDYCLKCDVKKFYPSINQDILYNIVQRKIKDKNVLWLLRDIIYSYPGGTNAPIGNLTSQWFGNLYLNELDQYLRTVLKVKGYVRYCDDFCVFGNDKAELHDIAWLIEHFIWHKLRLQFSKCDIFPTSRGVDFLGYRHFKDYMLVRKSTATRIKRRFKALPKKIAHDTIRACTAQGQVASANGVFVSANAWHLRRSVGYDFLHSIVA